MVQADSKTTGAKWFFYIGLTENSSFCNMTSLSNSSPQFWVAVASPVNWKADKHNNQAPLGKQISLFQVEVFWVVTPCSVGVVYHGGSMDLRNVGILRHNSEDLDFTYHRRESLKTRKFPSDPPFSGPECTTVLPMCNQTDHFFFLQIPITKKYH
jgi:hypothetical protein